jgi:hypothetical protein
MTYFGLKNLVSNETFVFSDPSLENIKALANEPPGMDKSQRRVWLSDPKTEHCVFSVWEGVNPSTRINNRAENPPWTLHGLVADYDAPSPGDLAAIRASIEQILPPSLVPQWGVVTPSGHHRLVWEFESPVVVGGSGDAFILQTLEELKRLLKLPLLLAGLDEAALKKPAVFYDISGLWERFNSNPLFSKDAQGAFYDAVKRISKSKKPESAREIPMDLIFEEINRKFPGRWPTDLEFRDGVLGPAVWHPDAKSNSSTIYRPWGAYCFSAVDKLFKSYAEILGKDFTKKFEENRIGVATENIFYVPGLGYYRRFPDGHHRAQPKEDLAMYLTGGCGLSRTRGENNTLSEVESALLHIQQAKVLDGAVPVVFDKRETFEIGGKRLLNLARVRVMEPDTSTPNPVWGQGFPWIAGWLMGMFKPRKQIVYLLAWLKLFYEGARDGSLQKGHVIFLVGGTGLGKTLMNEGWIPMLMGGGVNASSYFVKGEKFVADMMEFGHWHIDDSEAASDRATHTKFSERVKSLVANGQFEYQPKFVNRVMVPHKGRLMVTLNNDPMSLLMIPDLDRNIEDKLIVLGLPEKTQWAFPSRSQTERTLRAESPHFLNWLINWEPPKFMAGPGYRWGMRNYIHPIVRKDATASSFDGDIFGVLDLLWETDNEWVELKKKGEPWVGTAAQLTQIISSYNNMKTMMAGLSVRSIGMRLSKLSKTPGAGVHHHKADNRHKGQAAKYEISPLNH